MHKPQCCINKLVNETMSIANQAFPRFLSNFQEFTFGEVLNYSEKMVSHNDSKLLPIQWCLFYATLR